MLGQLAGEWIVTGEFSVFDCCRSHGSLSAAVVLHALDATLQKASQHCCASSGVSLERNFSWVSVYLLPSALTGLGLDTGRDLATGQRR